MSIGDENESCVYKYEHEDVHASIEHTCSMLHVADETSSIVSSFESPIAPSFSSISGMMHVLHVCVHLTVVVNYYTKHVVVL